MNDISLTDIDNDNDNDGNIDDEPGNQITKKLYFTGLDHDSIIKDEPEYKMFLIKPELYISTMHDNKKNTRVFLDTKLLKIRNRAGIPEPNNVKIVYKCNDSVGLSVKDGTGPVVYVTEALMNAEFKKMSSKDFIASFFAPLDKANK